MGHRLLRSDATAANAGAPEHQVTDWYLTHKKLESAAD
jgi:hypothetical protein